MRLIRLLKNDLAKETVSWVEKEIISPEQAAEICKEYGIDYYNQSRHSYGYFVLTILGFLFIGLALITIIGANWENIPRGIRMAGVISMTLLVNGIGVYKLIKESQRQAIGYFFLGSLFYGASIMLIAQIYHIGEHFPDGIFWWAAGTLPLALLLESTLLLSFTAALAFLWFFIESSLQFYPALFPLFLLALWWHCFQVKKSSILFLALISGVGFWLEYSFSWLLGDFHSFRFGVENIFIGIALFISFYGIAHWLDKRDETAMKDYGVLLGTWGLRFTLISLLVFSFSAPWQGLFLTQWRAITPALIVILSLSFSAIWLTKESREKNAFITIVSLSFMAIVLLTILEKEYGISLSYRLQIIDNIVVIATGVWLLINGIRHSISHYFFLGILVILLTGFLRYIDLIGDYIGAALLFILFAAILLSAAYFWKSHNRQQNKLL